MQNKKQISVVIPAYNEADNIAELITRLSNTFIANKYEYEIIVIDDKSSDPTFKIVKALSAIYPIKAYRKEGRRGKAFSLAQGFARTSYSNIGFIDADLQYAPEEMSKMLEKIEKGADIVVANRKRYKDSFIRKVMSKGFRFGFGKTLFGLNHDIQSGLKVFTREVLDTVHFKPTSQWTFDLEFLFNASEAGFVIKNHDITFQKRQKGASKVSVLRTASEIGSSALSLKLSPVHPQIIKPETRKTMRGAGLRYKKKKYVTHTTLNHKHTSIKTFTTFQRLLMVASVALIGLGIFLNPMATFASVIAILSGIYFLDTLFNLGVVIKSLHYPQEITVSRKALANLNDDDLPVYTILCPLYKEAHIIPQFVENISKLSWPMDKLDVMLLLEEDDKGSIEAVKKMSLPSFVRVVVVPESQPKTKPKACNYGLSYAKGEYLVIFDAEDMPDPMQLKKAYLSFRKAGKNIVCLQAKLNYYNPSQNLLTRFFTAEYSLWFDVTLTGLQSINTTIPLGGTSNHFRTKDIKNLEGWDPFNVTEDADLGMRLFKAGYKTAIIDSITLEEANSKWGNWLRQRSRWIKGYMQTYLVHTRNSFSFAKKKGAHLPIFHLVIGGKIAFILINPLLWIATVAYFTLYAYVGPAIERLYPALVFYMAVFSLVFGNFLFMYYYMIGVMKREHYSLIKYVYLIPFYWLMISVAGFIALYQLFFKPFYWEKTVHGLHLLKKEEKKTPAVVPVGKPGFGFATVLKIASKPFIVLGNVEQALVKGFAWTLIFIGKAERAIVIFLVLAFKKLIVVPFKYATSLF